MEPDEMAALVVETERAWMALGQVYYGLTEKEHKSQIFRRSLYVAEDLAAGDVLTESNLRIIRPGLGLPPKYFESLIGMRVGRAVRRGTPMSWELLTSPDDNVAPSQELPRGARA
jgi:N-acetylneuraminate synthase